MVWKKIISCFGKLVNDEELGDIAEEGGEGEAELPTEEHVEEVYEQAEEEETAEGDTELAHTTGDGIGETGGLLN